MNDIIERLRYAEHVIDERVIKIMDEAADIIEQQAARIAELEAEVSNTEQRTAEACAKAVFEQAKYFGYNVHAEAVRDAALNKWREYL